MFKYIIILISAIVGGLLCPELGIAGMFLFVGATTMVTGARATDAEGADAVRKVIDFDDVSLLDPNKAPFLALISRIGKKNAINPKFYHVERVLPPRWDVTSAASTAASTTLTVTNYAYFTAGDVVEIVRTGELVSVDTTPTSTSVTVTRSIGETAAAAILAADDLQIIGNGNEEGASKRTLLSTVGSEVYNYCQIFRNPFGVTLTEMNSENYDGKDIDTQRKEWGIAHAVDIERSLLFGERALVSGGGAVLSNPERYSRGILRFIEAGASAARIRNQSGALTETDFETWLRAATEYDSTAPRVIFISRLMASVISGFASAKLEMVPKDKTYGIAITKYLSPMGEFNLIMHHLLTGDVYGGYGICVALNECKYRPLQNRDTKLKMGIEDNDADTEEDEYITEAGLQVKHPEKHAIIKGITG